MGASVLIFRMAAGPAGKRFSLAMLVMAPLIFISLGLHGCGCDVDKGITCSSTGGMCATYSQCMSDAGCCDETEAEKTANGATGKINFKALVDAACKVAKSDNKCTS